MLNIKNLSDDPCSPYKILMHYDILRKLSKGENVLPIVAELDLCDSCNHRCIYCIYRDIRDFSNALSIDDIKSFITQFKDIGIKAVVIKGGGEPTIHPHFADTLYFLKENGIKIGLITNGTNMNEKNAIAIVDCCEWVRVSLDAADKNTHDIIHKPIQKSCDFDSIITNIHVVRTLQKESNKSLVIGINFVVCKENYTQIDDIMALAKATSVDYISFRNELNIRHYTEEEQQYIYDTFKYIKTLSENEVRIYTVYPGFSSFENRKWKKCIAPSLYTIVQANGDIVSCCDSRGIKSHIFGNILQNKLQDIWHAECRCHRLQNLITSDCNTICTNRYNYYNEIIDYIMGEGAIHKEFI